MTFRAVIFDWRGTLVSCLSGRSWVREALVVLGRDSGPENVAEILGAINAADGPGRRLDAPGMDADVRLHRRTFLAVLADAGLDRQLAEALYAVESDVRHNPFADDVFPALSALRRAGCRLAVLSDIHVDVRPAFEAAGIRDLIDVFTLSFERGMQKPDPRMFTRTLATLGTQPAETLMVGDRAGSDGPAVELGITTLLLPALLDRRQCRLRHVLALVGVPYVSTAIG